MIVDLRDYTTTTAGRDKLIERCEGLLWDEQERMGATFLGGFRDLEHDDRFVFLRAMPDLETRKRVLTDFYSDGEMWRANREEVNGWLVDSDNVLLLRPISELAPPAKGTSVVGLFSHVEPAPLSEADAARLRQIVQSAVASAAGRLLVTFATDPAENNYPRHPIRSGEHGLVWFATFAGAEPPRLTLPGVEQRWLAPISRSRMR